MSQKLVCPNCGTAFEVSESDYAAIAKQVRDREFEKDLSVREQAARTSERLSFVSEKEGLTKEIHRLHELVVLMEQEKKSCEELAAAQAREQMGLALREKEEELAYYKDFKARQSTKMVGESLELWCEDEFNKVRAGAFSGVYFEKDNEVSDSGSKGDYIYREELDGQPFLSIMFEMKNETDAGAGKKHKNRDFFKELDKDRNEKHCEYAVLVSLLEPDSELYNSGIVDMSHVYPKLYVVRPQCFLTIIGILRNQARSTMELRGQLAQARQQNADICLLEDRLSDFKSAFGRNCRLAQDRYDDALKEIDAAIDRLEKVKKALLSSGNHLRLADDKLEGLTVNKLKKGLNL